MGWARCRLAGKKIEDWPGKIQQQMNPTQQKGNKGKKGRGTGKSSIGMLFGYENKLLHGPSPQLHDAFFRAKYG